jgi:hypothetical protein
MGRGATLLLAVLVSGPGAAASAEPKRAPASSAFLEGWDDFVLDGAERPGLFELRLHLGGEGWDNLRQSPASTNPEPTAGARSEARLTYRPFAHLPLKTHLEAGQLRYDTRPTTSALGGGVAFEGDRHTLHFSTRVERGRPSIDIGVGGDVTNDALLMRLRYALRTKRLEWWAGADRARQRFSEASFRDGTLQGFQTGLSLPGLGPRLTPELVLAWSQNAAAGDSEFDWQQRRAQVGLRYTPTRSVALTARFELSAMEWGVTRPTAVNFARRDHRRYFSLQSQIRVLRQVAWTIVYDRLDNTSTRANRDFSSDYVAASLTVRLGSTNTSAPGSPAPPRPPVPRRPIAEGPPPPVAPARREPVVVVPPPVEIPAETERVAFVDGAGRGLARIEAVRRGDDTETLLRGEGLVRYSTLDLDGPPRFVVDLVGVTAAPLNVPVDTLLVRGIRVAAFRAGVARVVFDLKAPVVARVERDGDTVRVILRPMTFSASGTGPR